VGLDDPLLAALGSRRRILGGQRFQEGRGLADDAELDRLVAPDMVGVGIDVDQALVRPRQAAAERRLLAQPRADGDDQVGLVDRLRVGAADRLGGFLRLTPNVDDGRGCICRELPASGARGCP